MEAFVADLGKPARERFVIGCFLICTFMRARFSDMMNLVDFTADDFNHHGLPGGYVEAKVTRTKSAYTLERKTMYLPMTSPRCCLTGLDWFRGWQHARMMDSVPRGEGIPVFPALTNQGWSKIPMTAGAAADWLRKILLHLGFTKDRVDRLGTHSCKATTLSWLSKFGEPLEIRSLLGYHQTQGSALVYSRDAMAGPIRRLEFVLEQIRGRKFLPDQSRSGYFVDGGPLMQGGEPSAADTETEVEISDIVKTLLMKRMTLWTSLWLRHPQTKWQNHGMSMQRLKVCRWIPLQRCFGTLQQGISTSLLMKRGRDSGVVVKSPHHISSLQRSPSSARLNVGNASGEMFMI